MKVVRPATITAANLTTNATETIPAWSGVTAYLANDEVSLGFSLYRAIAPSTNKNPETDPAADTYWLRIGPSNMGGMFDNQTSTVTARAADVTVTVTPDGNADSVALLYVTAAAVNVTVSDGVTEYYNQDFTLNDTAGIGDWYDYFFEPIVRKTELFVTGLPNILQPEITIATSGPDVVSIGHCVVGLSREIGETEMGAQPGFDDLSRINVDETGAPESITPRAFLRRNRFEVWVEDEKVDFVMNLLASYRATPIVVIGAEAYTCTYGFGVLKAAHLTLAHRQYSIFDIELQGF